ncbi:probable serine/threonine-protein kinase roco5 [Pecten maximus]|uniref:probable serine/threonine-protein kinase roco5 n=1 Tax=Pecten maximus TaxID=6579 RepID=UPI00145877E9|nr:probable serine/threonine-protein kinase roco5 [Pecten maximus]
MCTETEEGDEEVKGFVTIYDFGGEKVFYNTHHCFMSSNMVFVVVFDVAMCLDSSRSVAGYEITEYWLKNIATYAIDDRADGKRTPPIILVGSHLDKVSSDVRVLNMY